MKDFKYRAAFSSKIFCRIDEPSDKFLSQASLETLKKIVPAGVELSDNKSLIPVAFDSCVINRANKNHDVVDTETGIKIAKLFPNTPIDIEHDRMNIIGHILGYAFTKFAYPNEETTILDEAAVAASKNPFTVSLSGVVYKSVNSSFIKALLENVDPESPNYRSISASWELGFNAFSLMVGSKNFAEAEIISDPDKIDKMMFHLKRFGGSGKLEDGRAVYCLLQGEVCPLGIGFTTSPAAEVSGVYVPTGKTAQASEENKEKISQSGKTTVKDNSNMKIIATKKELEALKPEELTGEVTLAASIYEEFKKDIAEKASAWAKEKETLEQAKKDSEAAQAKVADDLKKAQQAQADIQQKLTELENAQKKAAADQLFQTRMASLDETYDLDDTTRKVVAKSIEGLDEEKFKAWFADFEILSAAKKKSICAKCKKAQAQCDCKDGKKGKETQASTSTASDDEAAKKKAAEEALKNASVATAKIPTTSADNPEEWGKLEKAFSGDAVKISVK